MVFLLMVIFFVFTMMGLPSSILGAIWPIAHPDLNADVTQLGTIFMVLQISMVVATLLGNRLINRFSNYILVIIGIVLMMIGLVGYSISPNHYVLMLFAIPLGFGIGSIDVSLTTYVSKNFQTKHVNWLQSFWGLGATLGPIVMSVFIVKQEGWRTGYQVIAGLQMVSLLVIVLSRSLWSKKEFVVVNESTTPKTKELFKIPYLKIAIVTFFLYIAVEHTFGLWISSFLVEERLFSEDLAATVVSMFYIGIAAGRIIAGFISIKLKGTTIIRIGQGLIVTGILVLLLNNQVTAIMSVLLIGLGCAPIFPTMLHQSRYRFGDKHLQAVIGLQISLAYMASIVMQPFFGQVQSWFGLKTLPLFIGIAWLGMVFFSEMVNHKLRIRDHLLLETVIK